ncbi:MAG: glycerol-3-phosphate dehydrogenase [Clostridia bacterium]|nr:glycerol-3-phosphate dehydrogenase [Clostridia bacterium]
MRVSVIGCGRWGTLISWYLDSIGHEVALYGRSGSAHMQRLIQTRKNDVLELPESIGLITSLNEALKAETIIVAIGSQSLRQLCQELCDHGMKNKTVVLCMKGLEKTTGKRLSVVVSECLDASNKVAVWLGPGHVQDFYAGIPSCMVIDSEHDDVKKELVDAFSSNLIRFYYGRDLIGNEIGAAAKNVIGIGAGMLDGLGLSTLKGPLMSRGTREIARLIKSEGGSELSAYGLCHLGDYQATIFSQYSHNRQFGESFIKKEPYGELAEGYETVQALVLLAEKNHVDLPICQGIYEILYHGADCMSVLSQLFTRSLKDEF